MDEALCKQVGLFMFFPEKGDVAKVVQAKQICAQCSVVAECLNYGMGEEHGIWGGTTVGERRLLRRKQRRAGKSIAA